MTRFAFILVLTACLFAVSAQAQIQLFPTAKAKKAAAAKEEDPVKDDGKWLSEKKLSADDPKGLIEYLKSRTLSDAELAKIQAVIKRMGDESFEARIQASAEAIAFGHAAIGPLRTAATMQASADPEIQFRALETLKAIDPTGNASFIASAAARALAKSKHADAATTLLDFLPMADNAAVDEDIRLALKSLAIRDGKLEPVLAKGLTEANPIRRAASAVALIEATLEDKSLRDEVTKLVVPMLRSEADGDAKFRVAFVMATKGRNADAVAALAEVIPSLPRGRIWQVEDVLVQLAGDKPPSIKLGADKVSLTKGAEEWVKWLTANRKPADYAAFNYKPRTNGRLAMLVMDQNWGGGRIVELGPDLRQRWRMTGITTPADFRIMPNGNVEVMEHNYSRLTERDTRGVVKNTRNLPGGPPMSMQRFDNGNVLIAYRQSVVEYDSNWKALNTWARNNQDILAAGRFGSGPTVALVQGNGGPNGGQLIRLDEKFKELPKPVKAGNPHWQAKLELLPNDRALVTEQDKVIEVDLKNDKVVWTYKCSNPTCVQRLPNGNTLICDVGNRGIREVAPDLEVVWQYTPPDGLQPLRAYRQ